MSHHDPIALARAVVARGHEGTEAHTLAVALLESNADARVLRAALGRCFEWFELHVEEVGYGYFPGGDPREFHPDPECSSEAERAAHKAACEAADRGEPIAPLPCHNSLDRFSDGPPFGLGSYTMVDKQIAALRDVCVEALATREP